MNSQDMASEAAPADTSGCPSPGDHCDCMVEYLRESHRMVSRLLQAADFDDAFPFVFGHPDVVGDEVAVQNELALLLYKAQMHLTAVIKASRGSNLHSMAVHARVILECAGQIQAKAQMVYEGSENAATRVLNASEYDFLDTMRRMSRGSVDEDDLREMIVEARGGIGDGDSGLPTRVRIAERVAHVPGGRDWHGFLSNRFCGSQMAPLSEPSMFGGVACTNTEADRLAVAVLLDYLTQQTILMIFSYEFVLIAVDGDPQPFEEASELLDRMKADAAQFRAWLAKQERSPAAALTDGPAPNR